MSIFNKRIIAANIYGARLQSYELSEEDLLVARDIFDKQIVDANGAKVVRVNDVKLEGLNTEAVLLAVDVGMRGIMRRLGVERGGEDVMRLLQNAPAVQSYKLELYTAAGTKTYCNITHSSKTDGG